MQLPSPPRPPAFPLLGISSTIIDRDNWLSAPTLPHVPPPSSPPLRGGGGVGGEPGELDLCCFPPPRAWTQILGALEPGFGDSWVRVRRIWPQVKLWVASPSSSSYGCGFEVWKNIESSIAPRGRRYARRAHGQRQSLWRQPSQR